MDPVQTDPTGEILSGSFAIFATYEHNQTKKDEANVSDWWKRGKLLYLACPLNTLKGPELSTLNFARTLVFGVSWPGWLKSFSIVTCTELRVRMHRLMCIFIISRFQTTFSHEVTAVSELYCQKLKDKTSILSLRQIIKMCYCRIHVHVHA